MRLTKFRRHKKLYQKVNLITVQFLVQPQTTLHTSNCTPRRKLIEIQKRNNIWKGNGYSFRPVRQQHMSVPRSLKTQSRIEIYIPTNTLVKLQNKQQKGDLKKKKNNRRENITYKIKAITSTEFSTAVIADR